MRFEKIWIEQCRATRAIKRRFGVKDAPDYLVGEKLRMFASAARYDAAFERELPRFLAAVWRVFNEYGVAPLLRCLCCKRRSRLFPPSGCHVQQTTQEALTFDETGVSRGVYLRAPSLVVSDDLFHRRSQM